MADRPIPHHTVPKFFLRRFAGPGDKIQLAHRDELEKSFPTHVDNATVQKHFYTLESEDGSLHTDVEEFFAQVVEPRGARAIRRIVDDGIFPPPPGLRQQLAEFCAFQLMRGEATRTMLLEDYDANAKAFLRLMTPEMLRTRLEETDGETPSDEEVEDLLTFAHATDQYRVTVDSAAKLHLPSMLETALELVPFLVNRRWALLEFDADILITGDEPVALLDRSAKPGQRALGVGTAAEVVLATDPRHAISMVRPDLMRREQRRRLAAHEAATYNLNLAYGCHRYVAYRPGTEPLNGVSVPKRGPAVTSKNGVVRMMLRPPISSGRPR